MSIDKKVNEEQLEFPFLNKIRMELYAKQQVVEMKSLYVIYSVDSEVGKGMKFGDFLADVWIKMGYARRFEEHNRHRYFYDAPYTKS